MPVSLPGFSSYNAFFDLFLPLKNEAGDCFPRQQPVTIDESDFTGAENYDKRIPLTEDCMRAVNQLIYQYADFSQKKYILRTLLHTFPNLPVELINAAHSLYMAIVRKENIDLAVLNTLGLASCHLLADGNAISQLALFIRQTILDWVGEGVIKQFLGMAENSPDVPLFTALAIMSIALKYWLSDPAAPQRRLLQIPPYLGNLVLRAAHYWDQLGQMSQHAAEQCLLPAKSAGQDYHCIREPVDMSRAEGVLQRDAWTCTEGQGSRWKTLNECNFALSAATLKQVSEEGVVATRRSVDPERGGFFRLEENPPPVSAAPRQQSDTVALLLPAMVPVIAHSRGKRAGQAALGALGASLLAFTGYAWYSMFGPSSKSDITQEQADLFGILSDDERDLLAAMASQHTEPPPEPQASSDGPFNADEIQQLKQLINSLEDERPPEQIFFTGDQTGLRAKRAAAPNNNTTPAEALSTRQNYWASRERKAAADSAEKPLLQMLKNGPQPGGNYSLSVPRESFPLKDAWFTRMDLLRLGDYSEAFQDKIKALSLSIARDKKIAPPATGLPAATWLHLGVYYEHLYKKVLRDWGKAILSMKSDMASEYSFAASQIHTIATNLNRDWNNKAIKPQALNKLAAQKDQLSKRYLQLQTFNVREREKAQILDELKNQTSLYHSEIPQDQFNWDNYTISFLSNIHLSKFTEEYQPIIKGFVDSNVEYWGKNTGLVDLVDFYTGMSVLALGRLRDALQDNDIKKAWNYAVLDEQLTQIVRENISPLWNKGDQEKYLNDYNIITQELLAKWWLMSLQLDLNPPRISITTPKPAIETTTIAPVKTFSAVDWERLRKNVEAAKKLPIQRFSAETSVQLKLQTALEETVKQMTDMAGRDILSPDQYIESWITNTLREYGLQGNYTSASLFSVDYPRHPDEEIKSFDGFGGRNNPPRQYSLQQLVRGLHREKDRNNRTKSRIFWPDNFPSGLRERLEKGISGDIDREIAALFDDNQQTWRDLYRVMTRRAALAYLARKNAVESTDYQHHVFAGAVAKYLKGEINAQLVLWHGSPISGLVFIPVKEAAKGRLSRCQAGVLLSVWSNDYYEVPWPGFVPSYRTKVVKNIKSRQKIVIESKADFRDFMDRFRTQRVGRNLARLDNAFDYEPRYSIASMKSQKVYTTGYNAPFSFTPLSAADMADRLIKLYREDIQDLYDNAIFSDAELSRAIIHERLNALAVISGVLLMGASLAFGGPAWAWVLASLGTSLFIEVAPNAVLYSKASSDDERELYLQSMIMSVAFEVGGSIVSEAAGPLIKGAVSRTARLTSKAFRTSLPQWYKFTRLKLEQVLARSGVRAVRLPGKEVVGLSAEAKRDLDNLIKKFEPAPKTGTNDEPQPGPSGSQQGYGTGPGSSFLQQQERLFDIAQQMEILKFNARYRVLTQWENVDINSIRNIYTIFGERYGDRVVIQIISQGKDYSCIYIPEDEWIRAAVKEAERLDVMLSYYDFYSPENFVRKYGQLGIGSSSMNPADYPKYGRHLFVPPQWQEKLASLNLRYDDIQKVMQEITPPEEESLSTTIRKKIEDSPALKAELEKTPRLDQPLFLNSESDEANRVMLRSYTLYTVGLDIEKFYPLPRWLPLMPASEDFLQAWQAKVTAYINGRKDLKLVKNNFILLKEAGGAGIVTVDNMVKIEKEFINLYGIVEKLSVLLAKAKQVPLIQEKILTTLAVLVNSTDPRILGEAYQRLDLISERLFKLAHYHVMEQRLAKVVPLTPMKPTQMQAFILSQDPLARIMIMLPQMLNNKDLAGLLLHEISHLAVHTEDFRYLNLGVDGYPKLAEHHVNFGQYALENMSPYGALGQSQQFIDISPPQNYAPLTEFDRAVALARVRAHPMLEAYVKMNNADSLVILINALMEIFEISPKALDVKNMANPDLWNVVIKADSSSSRKKRSAETEEDIFFHQFREDVLAAMLYQALTFTKEDILNNTQQPAASGQ